LGGVGKTNANIFPKPCGSSNFFLHRLLRALKDFLMGGIVSFSQTQKVDYSSFIIGGIIGKGAFSIVRSVTRGRKEYALKEIRLRDAVSSPYGFTASMMELEALKKLKGVVFVVELRYAFHDSDCCYLVTDKLCGGNIRHHLQNGAFTEKRIAYIMLCIGSALLHIHERGVMHRDVKPDNIAFDGYGRPYLIDFGICYLHLENSVPICSFSSGTLSYLAPEVLTPTHRHTFSADMWSLGIVMFEMLFSHRPFEKHCPTGFVYFAENQYSLLWSKAEQSGLSRVDWCSLDGSIEESERCSSMPYPNQHLPLTQGGQRTDAHKVPIPHRSLHAFDISADAIYFLEGLLDVRVSHRVGSESDPTLQFSQHPWFLFHGLNVPVSSYSQLTPPFMPIVSDVENELTKRFFSLSLPSPSPSSSLPPSHPAPPFSLTPEQQHSLDGYYYVSPNANVSPACALPPGATSSSTKSFGKATHTGMDSFPQDR
jgi:serine/threonine protein kinase